VEPEHKSKLYLLIYLLFAVGVGLIFWFYFRPKVLMASCSEAASQTSFIYARTTLATDNPQDYKNILDECLDGLKVKK